MQSSTVGLGPFLETVVKATRPAGIVQEKTDRPLRRSFGQAFHGRVWPICPPSPRSRRCGQRTRNISTDLPRFEQELRRAELEVQKAITSPLTGSPLAAAISQAKDHQRAAAQKLQDFRGGVSTFRDSLEKAKSAARAEILEHFRVVTAQRLHAELEKARQLQVKRLPEILDDLAAMEHVGNDLTRKTGIEEQVEELLRGRTVRPSNGGD